MFGFISNIVTSIRELPNAIKNIFIPNAEDITAIVTNFKEETFGFVDDIKDVANLINTIFNVSQTEKVLTIPYVYEKYGIDTSFQIDFSWYDKFRPYTQPLLLALIYIGFFIRLFFALPNIINGSAPLFTADLGIRQGLDTGTLEQTRLNR